MSFLKASFFHNEALVKCTIPFSEISFFLVHRAVVRAKKLNSVLTLPVSNSVILYVPDGLKTLMQVSIVSDI